MYNRSKIKSLGSKTLKCIREGIQYKIRFHVVKENVCSIIGYVDSQRLGFIKVLVNDNPQAVSIRNISMDKSENGQVSAISQVNNKTSKTSVITKDRILKKFPDVFEGMGELGEPCKINIDKTVTPVIHAPRRVPFGLQDKLKLKLDNMEGTVIEKVSEPTDWVSSMVVVTKPNSDDLRICIDPTDLNKAIKRNHYPLPIIEDVLPCLGKAKIFSVLDAKNGFWQVKLDKESSYLTTFNTPFGRYRWKRMPFGISSAPEEYQRRMHEALRNLKGVMVIADDILVIGEGKNDEEAVTDHDRNLEALLQRCQRECIKLNKEKIKLRLSEVTYIGHLLTKEGVRADPKKVEAINNLKAPTDVKSLKRFLGMVNYLSKFLPKLSDVTQPLRNLDKKNVPWEWNACHEEVFINIKKLIVEAPVLKYFDRNLEVTLQCDASMSGLGAVLMQNGQPVAYASKTLTDAEQRYAQIEKELLSIVFAALHFEQYIYGKKVNIETDHKPLENIFKKPLLQCPKRLQSMLLQLQKFDLNVQYKSGNKMFIADTLSRDYLPNTQSNVDKSSVISICEEISSIQMSENVAVTNERLEDIRQKTALDVELQTLRDMILYGWPVHYKNVPEIIRPYFKFRDELSVENGIIFRGPCIVVPMSLRPYMLKQIHYAHNGIDATIRYGRDILYWPSMSAQLKNYVASCKICNQFSNKQQRENLKSHEFPSRPWSKVGMDIFTIGKHNYLILVDYFSSYFEVISLETMEAKTVIAKVKSYFARYGIPDIVMTDCGTQFTSHDFQKLVKEWCFKHVKSSPHHHQSNGKAENAVKIAKRLFQKAKEDGRDPLLALLEWRNTPTEGFNSSPAQRFIGRRTQFQLPITDKLLKPNLIKGIPKIQKKKLENQKKYYNRSSRNLKVLKPGDVIRLQPNPGEKYWKKGKVVEEISPRKYKVSVNGKYYVRNRKFLRYTTEGGDEIESSSEYEDSGPEVEAPTGRVEIEMDASPEQQGPINPQHQDQVQDNEPYKTQRGREIRRPRYLNDFVTI